MNKVYTKMRILIAVGFVLAWLGTGNASRLEAERNDPDRPPTGSAANKASSASAESNRWRFVVFGDTRDATQDTQTGISPLLGKMAEAIAAEKPALVIHIGDLINGFYTHKKSPLHGNYEKMFENWKRAVKPIHDFDRPNGHPLYAVRGNS